jgi:hypothetical protein
VPVVRTRTVVVLTAGRGQPPERAVDRGEPQDDRDGEDQQRDLRPVTVAHPDDRCPDDGDAQERDTVHVGAGDRGRVAFGVGVALGDDGAAGAGVDEAVHAEVAGLVRVVGEQHLADPQVRWRHRTGDDE